MRRKSNFENLSHYEMSLEEWKSYEFMEKNKKPTPLELAGVSKFYLFNNYHYF